MVQIPIRRSVKFHDNIFSSHTYIHRLHFIHCTNLDYSGFQTQNIILFLYLILILGSLKNCLLLQLHSSDFVSTIHQLSFNAICELTSYYIIRTLYFQFSLMHDIITNLRFLQTRTGVTPLMLCAKAGNVECISVLLDSKADVEIEDDEGWTALHYSALRYTITSVFKPFKLCQSSSTTIFVLKSITKYSSTNTIIGIQL